MTELEQLDEKVKLLYDAYLKLLDRVKAIQDAHIRLQSSYTEMCKDCYIKHKIISQEFDLLFKERGAEMRAKKTSRYNIYK